MGANSFGNLFNITTFGESHGKAIGVIIDGCPPNVEIDIDFIQSELDRRRPGQSKIVTQRQEADRVEILSGVFEGYTTGTPIMLLVMNKDARSKDYSHIASKFRPSHADFTYQTKYGIRDYRGGGRSSARETAARVAAGAIAKIILKKYNIEITGYVSQVGHIACSPDYKQLDFSKIEDTPVRCPDSQIAEEMIGLIKEIKKSGDTIGGIVNTVVKGCPVGLGEPVFDKLHARLASAMLGINACKGFEYGSGFDSVTMKGSQHNDIFEQKNGLTVTQTNHSGGIQGGISNGMDIYFRCAFKPVATIIKDQKSIDKEGHQTIVSGKGRHDPCVVPRAVPIVEAMTALVILDFLLLQQKNKTAF